MRCRFNATNQTVHIGRVSYCQKVRSFGARFFQLSGLLVRLGQVIAVIKIRAVDGASFFEKGMARAAFSSLRYRLAAARFF